MSTNHPVQPLIKGRFKPNKIVVHLLDHGPFDMNRLAILEFTDEDRQQFAQLIGYSLGGYSELSYVTDEAFDRLIVGDPDPADDPRCIAACLKVCEGISTEVLELNATAGGVAGLERQRNELKAALEGLVLFTNPKPFNALALHNAHQAIGSVYTDSGLARHPAVALLNAAEHILAILDHPTQSVHMLDAEKLRDAIAKAKGIES